MTGHEDDDAHWPLVQLLALSEVHLESPSVAAVLTESLERLTEVRRLHASDGGEWPSCIECGFPWPCATVRTVDGQP